MSDAIEAEDWDRARELSKRLSREQLRRFLRERNMTPEMLDRRRVPRKYRDEFDQLRQEQPR